MIFVVLLEVGLLFFFFFFFFFFCFFSVAVILCDDALFLQFLENQNVPDAASKFIKVISGALSLTQAVSPAKLYEALRAVGREDCARLLEFCLEEDELVRLKGTRRVVFAGET